MPTITIRNLSDYVIDALKIRAQRHGKSMEREVKEIQEERVLDRELLLQKIEAKWGSIKRPSNPDEIEKWINSARGRRA